MGLRRVNYIWAAITMTRGPHAGGQAASKKLRTAHPPYSFASFQEDGYAALEMFELYRGTPAGHRLSRMNSPPAKRLATL
jgi:hypothetical protein